MYGQIDREVKVRNAYQRKERVTNEGAIMQAPLEVQQVSSECVRNICDLLIMIVCLR
jgi:hypothetical protein